MLIPMTPPSGNMPNMEGMKTMTGDVQGPGVMKLGNENWIGCAARAGHVTRVADVVRAANEARVGNAPRVADAVRAGRAVTMRYRNQECGHPSEDRAQARGAPRKIGPASRRVPVHTATSRPEVVGMPHIRCPLKKNCRSSSS